MSITVAAYYDALLAEGQDPVLDPPVLKSYMDGWDGENFIRQMQLSPTASVLELGVGTGRLAVRVAPRCGRFLGVDIAPKTVERARTHLAPLENAAVLCADFLTYPFAERFDIVYSSLTWMHIEQKAMALERVAELLAPGGRFLLSTDKSKDREIVFGEKRIAVFPDDPKETERSLLSSGLSLIGILETERAYVFVAKK